VTDRDRYCTQCGLISQCDEDGCCVQCGADSCELGDLREHLKKEGLRVITEAEGRVLDAAGRMMFENDGCDCIEIVDDGGLPEAELARRAAKETP
jgi:hypothetical protein